MKWVSVDAHTRKCTESTGTHTPGVSHCCGQLQVGAYIRERK